MALQYKGAARTPGSLGTSPGTAGGRIPGPLGNRLWDQQSVSSGQNTALKGAKTTIMPAPTKDTDDKYIHSIDWPRYSSKNGPAFAEVKQGSTIGNCPVASMLAALASTSKGRTIIQGMLTETAATVITDLSALPPKTLKNPPKDMKIISPRFFTVKLPGGPIDVSDVFYTDDADRGYSPWYMRDPAMQSLWASIIEKALAVQMGSYEDIDAKNLTANAFWAKIIGADPGVTSITDSTPFSVITEAFKASTTRPSIAASKYDDTGNAKVSPNHGFAMLGLEGSKVKIYDPAHDPADPGTILLTPAEFRSAFQLLLWLK